MWRPQGNFRSSLAAINNMGDLRMVRTTGEGSKDIKGGRVSRLFQTKLNALGPPRQLTNLLLIVWPSASVSHVTHTLCRHRVPLHPCLRLISSVNSRSLTLPLLPHTAPTASPLPLSPSLPSRASPGPLLSVLPPITCPGETKREETGPASAHMGRDVTAVTAVALLLHPQTHRLHHLALYPTTSSSFSCRL